MEHRRKESRPADISPPQILTLSLILTHSFSLLQPEFVPNYGSASAKLPVVSVGPGVVELAVLKQEQVSITRTHVLGLDEAFFPRQQLECLASFAGGLAPRTPYSVSWCRCPTGILEL